MEVLSQNNIKNANFIEAYEDPLVDLANGFFFIFYDGYSFMIWFFAIFSSISVIVNKLLPALFKLEPRRKQRF